jgi:S1-C subfamily serine protease
MSSGTAFAVDQRGYLVTNYHVIEPAYRIQRAIRDYATLRHDVIGNVTAPLERLGLQGRRSSAWTESQAMDAWSPQALEESFPAQVFVRIDSTTQYQKCRIVDVQPALDLAVLKMETEDRPAAPNSNTTESTNSTERSNQSTTVKVLPSLTFGSSLDLLVGQSLVAIGNPFGLDTTVTTGVVSALQIDLTVASRPRLFGIQPVITPTIIRNGIQTDCAINPGNSGGPLLNLNGDVVGVTTAIVTTSGSNAGIGFAIPSQAVAPTVAAIIRRDVAQSSTERQRRGWLGLSIWKRQPTDGRDQPNWVAAVSPNSPAARAGIQTLNIGTASTLDDDPTNGIVVHYGDAIVAVGGEATVSYTALQTIMDRCVMGEQLALTLFNGVTRQRRVVYVTLETRP